MPSVLVWFFCIANEPPKKRSLKFIKEGKVNAKNSLKTSTRKGSSSEKNKLK